MNRRRQFFSTIGLGFLLVGGAAAVPREEFAAAAKSRRTLPPTAPEHRPEYKVLTLPAGDSVEDAFNAVARKLPIRGLGATLRSHRVYFRQMGASRSGRIRGR